MPETQILPLGEARELQVPDFVKPFLVEELKVFGFWISARGFDIPENWQETLDALSLKEYKVPSAQLSVYGKIATFMTYTLSKMWYRAFLI
ncbi:MAG: hypothetical protein GY861_04535 [bacterium]|nr:hypothetical protein [bacterium]